MNSPFRPWSVAAGLALLAALAAGSRLISPALAQRQGAPGYNQLQRYNQEQAFDLKTRQQQTLGGQESLPPAERQSRQQEFDRQQFQQQWLQQRQLRELPLSPTGPGVQEREIPRFKKEQQAQQLDFTMGEQRRESKAAAPPPDPITRISPFLDH